MITKYKLLHAVFLLLFCSIMVVVTAQQPITITGKVTGKNLVGGVPDVSVQLKGSETGAVTDKDGRYAITVPSPQAILVFSIVGYETREIRVGTQRSIDIELVEYVAAMDEVVIVGYAEQSKRKTTSSVSVLAEGELTNIPSVNPVQALQGKLAGVSIPVLSGQPGAGANIVIRGGTSLRPYGNTASGRDVSNRDPSDPLVIIDGVFREINDVNPDDIASIQVMKDAASTAIYGARGANGVIVIKTKSGKGAGKAKFSYRYQHGIDKNTSNYDYMNAAEYVKLARITSARGIDNFNINSHLYVNGPARTPTFTTPGQYENERNTIAYLDNLVAVEGQAYVDNLLATGWETIDDPVNPGRTIIFKDSRYLDVVWQPAHTSNHNFNIRGSTDAINYNLSTGFVNQGGTFLGTAYKRLSTLANMGFKVNEKFTLNLNFSYLWNDDRFSDNIVNDIVRGNRIAPIDRLYYTDGTPHIGLGNNPRNRLHQLYYQDFNSNTEQYVIRVGGDYEIIPRLHYRPSVSMNTRNFDQMNFEKYYPQQTTPRQKTQRKDGSKQLITDHVLQYNHTFASQHNLMVLGGFNYIRNTYFRVTATSQRSANDYISTITGDPITSIVAGEVVANMNASSQWTENKSASFFAQANYDFNNKYFFTSSIRYDGFSNFAPENRYATFPSLSVGWLVSNEDFWKSEIVNFLKLRSSWGKTGLSSLSINDTYGVYGASLYATESGITRSNLPNPKLLWETTAAFDIGVDVSFFNRINLTLDYYNKLTSNRLADLPLPGETGFNSIKYNVGSLRNRGFEVELKSEILRTKDFSWIVNASFAFNRAVVDKLPANGRDKNRINGGLIYDPVSGKDIEVGGYAEGERPGGLWAWQSNGIFATDAEARAPGVPVDMLLPGAMLGKPKNGGDVNWADVNGDGVINEKDLVFMGYRVPDKIGGMQQTFTYKKLSVRFAVDFAMGHVISNGALGRSMGQGRGSNEGAPNTAISDEAWQQQGDEGKKYPRFSYADADIGYRNHLRFISLTGYSDVGIGDIYGVDNSIYYSKGDWMAFREISFSYSIPSSFTRKFRIQNLSLNAGVYNLGYWTAYKGINPEVYKGYDAGEYTRPLQFRFGAVVDFL